MTMAATFADDGQRLQDPPLRFLAPHRLPLTTGALSAATPVGRGIPAAFSSVTNLHGSATALDNWSGVPSISPHWRESPSWQQARVASTLPLLAMPSSLRPSRMPATCCGPAQRFLQRTGKLHERSSILQGFGPYGGRGASSGLEIQKRSSCTSTSDLKTPNRCRLCHIPDGYACDELGWARPVY